MKTVFRGRPKMPVGYGIEQEYTDRDLVPWEKVEERLVSARNYWIGSTIPGGRPHAMPVWGVWVEGAFFFSTDPVSRKGKNLAANPEVVVHLESGDDVVILEGSVEDAVGHADLKKVDLAYYAKYQFHMVGDEAPSGTILMLRPRKALAWSEHDFPKSATRWMFDVTSR